MNETATKETHHELMEKIVSLCKRRGFIFPGSEIYGGLAGTFDYGPLGVALKKAIQETWRKRFITERDDMYEVDADIIMNPKVWEASGHVHTFADPLIQCVKCGSAWRTDAVITSQLANNKNEYPCPKCQTILGTKEEMYAKSKQFNMMFPIRVGASDESSSVVYLRAETAPGMFVNFKNIIDTFHPKLPFGMGQIGKAFRNEINPRDFIFRLRELEQMEIEYFCHPSKWEESFEHWRVEFRAWMESLGLKSDTIHEIEIRDGDRAHYSDRTIDFEFDFPIGQKELAGLAYRTDFDLKKHTEFSKNDLSYFDEELKERFFPHCIEPSIGVERVVLAVLTAVYKEEQIGEELRTVLAFPAHIAPIQIAVLPLSKKEELTLPAHEILKNLRKIGRVAYDETQSIGKRYRRQDEIGTPYCVTVDFDTLTDNAVTVRDRDTMEQIRIPISELQTYFTSKIL